MQAFQQIVQVILQIKDNVSKVVTNINETFDQQHEAVNRNAKSSKKWGKALQSLRQEMLGIMFFGSALLGLSLALFGPVLQMTGVFELLSLILALIFLPIMMELLPYLLDFLEWVGDQDEETLKLIGKIVLFIGVVGLLITVFGMLFLGFTNIITAMTALAPLFSWLGGIISLPFLLALAIATLVATGIYDAWTKNFLNIELFMKNYFRASRQAWEGLKVFIVGLWETITGFLTGDTERAKKGIVKIIQGMVDLLIGILMGWLSWVAIIGIGLINIIVNVAKVWLQLFSGFFVDLGKKFAEWYLNAQEWGTDIMYALGRSISRAAPKVLDIFVNLGLSIITGFLSVVRAIGDMFGGLIDFSIGGFSWSFPGLPSFGDFISRPGQGMARFSPQDTIIGVKDTSLLGGKGATINQNLTIYAMNDREVRKIIQDENRKAVDEIRRVYGR